jgi:glycosyltransferase involved in cell wall biosynthesis
MLVGGINMNDVAEEAAAAPVRISIVTPNFNMAGYLDETIRSVLANCGPGDEYFVIDGCSTDGSVDIIRQHEAALTGWTSEPDRGYADALAKGFARATGDVLCWINSGDVLLSGTFDAVRRIFAAGDVDMIFGDDFYIDERSRVLRFSRGRVRDIAAAMLYGGWTPLQDACFWTREIYCRVGGVDRGLRYAADYDFFLRLVLTGRTRHAPFAFGAYRRHPGQLGVSGARTYSSEREQVRLRELKTARDTPFVAWIKRMYYLNANRLRARIGWRMWQRPELIGRTIGTLSCSNYWRRDLRHHK